MKKSLLLVLLAALLIVVVALPLNAQTPTPDPNTLVVVVGTVDLGQGVIMVNNYIIAPASAFPPTTLQQGDLVVVIGYLLPDGVTILAISIELFNGTPTPTPIWTSTPNPTLTITPTFTPTFIPTLTPTPDLTATLTPINPTCNQPNHPVAQRLAQDFGVSYDEIIGWHCAGFGFGEIARAYLLADATGADPASYFAQRQAGLGWGEIVRQAGVHPSELAPGQVTRRGGNDEGNGNGNGNGNGRGNGNGNGRGNGNGNGNGNGRGNGRGNNGG